MNGTVLGQLIIDTITKSILVEADNTQAREAAKRLGLIYKKFGRWAHPNNPKKIVAKTINGKLTRLHPDDSNKPAEIRKTTDFEKKAIQKDTDVAKGLLDKEGPAILSRIQKSINTNSSDNEKAAKLYALRDSIMDLIPLEHSGKIPQDVKSVYSNHKIKQMAQIATHRHGSTDGAIKAAQGSINNENHPVVSRLLSNSK